MSESKELRELAAQCRQNVTEDMERWQRLVALADAYVACAADQLDQGSYTHALQLVRRAGEVCSTYSTLHSALGGSQ